MSKEDKKDLITAAVMGIGLLLMFISVNVIENTGFSLAPIVTALIGAAMGLIPIAIKKYQG